MALSDAAVGYLVVDSQSLAVELRNLAKKVGLTLKEVFRYEMGLWGEDLVRSTFPRGVSDTTKEKLRRSAVGDAKRLFLSLDRTEENWTPIAGDGAYHALKAQSGAVFAVEEPNYLPNAGAARMHEWHQQHRTRRGRVPRSALQDVTINIGRAPWLLSARMAVSGTQYAKYIAQVARGIGRAKAGWLAMVTRFRARRPPGWIDRHEQRGESWVHESHKEGAMDMIAENRVPYASDLCRGIVAHTMRVRQRAIDKLATLEVAKVVALFNRLRGKRRI